MHSPNTQIKPSKLMPVMLYIHGGGFVRGSSSTGLYSPDYLLQKDVVLITFNYRLGAFGFLSFDDPSLEIPGNAGLKDQTLALKWVRQNAEYFGGDPTNITLFGESAGGCSVHYHMVSEMSEGLFERAIVMSGCVLNNWSVVPPRNWGERLAKACGWDGSGGAKGALETLRNTNGQKIVEEQERLLTREESRDHILFAFGPVVEPYVSAQCFIPTAPLKMIQNPWSVEIPILIGGVSEEGLFAYKGATSNPILFEHLGDFEHYVPLELDIARDSPKGKEFGRRLKEFYYHDEKPSLANIETFINIVSDQLFWHGVHRTILSRLSKKNSGHTYLYRFNVDSPTQNHYRVIMCGETVRGVCHADDLSYIFKNDYCVPLKPDSIEMITIQRMVGLLTQFAISGNPNHKSIEPNQWKPLEANTRPFKCLNIGDNVEVIDLPETKRMELWDSLYEPEQLF